MVVCIPLHLDHLNTFFSRNIHKILKSVTKPLVAYKDLSVLFEYPYYLIVGKMVY